MPQAHNQGGLCKAVRTHKRGLQCSSHTSAAVRCSSSASALLRSSAPEALERRVLAGAKLYPQALRRALPRHTRASLQSHTLCRDWRTGDAAPRASNPLHTQTALA